MSQFKEPCSKQLVEWTKKDVKKWLLSFKGSKKAKKAVQKIAMECFANGVTGARLLQYQESDIREDFGAGTAVAALVEALDKMKEKVVKANHVESKDDPNSNRVEDIFRATCSCKSIRVSFTALPEAYTLCHSALCRAEGDNANRPIMFLRLGKELVTFLDMNAPDEEDGDEKKAESPQKTETGSLEKEESGSCCEKKQEEKSEEKDTEPAGEGDGIPVRRDPDSVIFECKKCGTLLYKDFGDGFLLVNGFLPGFEGDFSMGKFRFFAQRNREGARFPYVAHTWCGNMDFPDDYRCWLMSGVPFYHQGIFANQNPDNTNAKLLAPNEFEKIMCSHSHHRKSFLEDDENNFARADLRRRKDCWSKYYIDWGMQCWREKQYDYAAGHFQKAVESDATSAMARTTRGLFNYEVWKKSECAMTDFKAAIEEDDTYAPAYANLGWILTKPPHEEYDKALEYFNTAIEKRPNFARGLSMRALLLWRQYQKVDEATQDLTQAVKAESDFGLAYAYRGLMLKFHYKVEAPAIQKDGSMYYKTFDHALANYNKSVNCFPTFLKGNPNNDKLPAVYYNRARLLHKQFRRFDEALKDYNKVIDYNPRLARAYFGRGQLYCDHFNNYTKALKDFDKAIALNPQYSLAYNHRATMLEMKLNRKAEALMDYTKALEFEPENGIYYYNRGDLLEKMDCFERGQQDFAKAAECGHVHSKTRIRPKEPEQTEI